MERFVHRLATIRALLDAPSPPRVRRVGRGGGDRAYLNALLRIDDRYTCWPRAGARERGLYRRTARLWRVIDEAMSALGVEPPDTVQALSESFRRARGLLRGSATRAWLRRNRLTLNGFAELVELDARLALISEASRIYTLGLPDGIEPVCWLHDAIRLSGVYPSLRRRVVAAARAGDGGRYPRARDLERALREYWARLGEPVPEDVEEHARSLDFTDGGAELAAALVRRSAIRHVRHDSP